MENFIKIFNSECIEKMSGMKDSSVDLIFADPPYWMRVAGVLHRVEGTEYDGCSDEWDNQFTSLQDYNKFTHEWLRECRRLLKPTGSIWVIGGMQCIYTIGNAMQETGFWLINDIIWHKRNPTPNFKGTRLNNSHETLIWAAKDKNSKYTFHYKTAKELNLENVSEADFHNGLRKQLGSVWKIPVCTGNERLRTQAGAKLHSTQKPEELLYRVICISSNPGDVILDPFGGTMTTGAVAKKTGRSFIGIEANATYCEYGKQRIDLVEEQMGNIENAVFDIKPLKVKFTDMIDDGFLREGEAFYTKNKIKHAVLQRDGKLLFDNGSIANIHDGAAVATNSKADKLNGFNVWYVERDNRLVSIDDIRNQYRETQSNGK